MFACLLAIACTKAMPEELSNIPAGEKVTFAIPETKVAIGTDEGDGTRNYVFESDDIVYAVTTEGSVAAMEYKGGNRFAGEFSKPVGADEKISLYYACYSAESNAPAYVQNGKPWLVSLNNEYSRDENNTIVLTAALDAPEGVVGMPIISGFGACTVDFSAKTADIASFDGTSFSGGKTISGLSLESHSEADADEYTAVVNLPAGMEGGFWLKVSKDSQTMYRSSAATVSDRSFKMDSFTAATVNLNVTISGFPTTYSYGVGTDGVSKNVSTANGKSNAWMGSGTATYTISQEGIPAALLTFQSFTISGEGISASGDETTKTISVGETSSHTSWGAKTITATVTYKDIAGNTYSKSASVTRHITGLPYSVTPPSNSGSNPWSITRGSNKISFNSDHVALGKSGTVTENPLIKSPVFSIPAQTSVSSTVKYTLTSKKVLATYHCEFYMYIGGTKVLSDKSSSTGGTTSTKNISGTLTTQKAYIEFETNTRTELSGNAQVWSVSLNYQ